MRFASGCLVALFVAYTCFGQTDQPVPACPKAACPTSACANTPFANAACATTACSKTASPTTNACPATGACPATSLAGAKTATGESSSACAKNSDCPNNAACESITDCAASRVAARLALAKELAACQTQTTTDTIARHPQILEVGAQVIEVRTADTGECASKECAAKECAGKPCESTKACTATACHTAKACNAVASHSDYSAHTPACRVASGVAATTCTLTSDTQLLAACEAAKACASRTECAPACEKTVCESRSCEKGACEKKSCDTAVAAACPASACAKAGACEKSLASKASSSCQNATACESSNSCPTAVTVGNVLIRPATSFLAAAVATDGPATCNSGATACCEGGKDCASGVCCRQGEAMASISDEVSAEAGAGEACAEAPCAATGYAATPCVVSNSNAGYVGAIACDTGVESVVGPAEEAAAEVATGSYLEMHLSHLTKAAEHLTEAGFTEEASSVQELANKLRQELIATKQAQIAGLEAEIAALEADCASVCRARSTDSAAVVPVCPQAVCALEAGSPATGVEPECSSPVTDRGPVAGRLPAVATVQPAPQLKSADSHDAKANKQILLKVKVVEVSLSRLKKVGFSFAEVRPGTVQSGDYLPDFLSALEREHLAHVVDSSNLLLSDREPGSFLCGGYVPLAKAGGRAGECVMQEVGTRINACVQQLDADRVRIEFHPRITHVQTLGVNGPGVCVREVDAGFETTLGKTVVLGGACQNRMVFEKDPETLKDREVHDVKQTFFLVTPHAMDVDTAVQPVSHTEPIAR